MIVENGRVVQGLEKAGVAGAITAHFIGLLHPIQQELRQIIVPVFAEGTTALALV